MHDNIKSLGILTIGECSSYLYVVLSQSLSPIGTLIAHCSRKRVDKANGSWVWVYWDIWAYKVISTALLLPWACHWTVGWVWLGKNMAGIHCISQYTGKVRKRCSIIYHCCGGALIDLNWIWCHIWARWGMSATNTHIWNCLSSTNHGQVEVEVILLVSESQIWNSDIGSAHVN